MIRNGMNNYGVTIPYCAKATYGCRAWYGSRLENRGKRLRITMKWSDNKKYNVKKLGYRKFFTKEQVDIMDKRIDKEMNNLRELGKKLAEADDVSLCFIVSDIVEQKELILDLIGERLGLY